MGTMDRTACPGCGRDVAVSKFTFDRACVREHKGCTTSLVTRSQVQAANRLAHTRKEPPMSKTAPGVPKRAGSKGEAVVSALAAKGAAGATRNELAEAVGCTVARVGEVIRALGGTVTKTGKVYSLTVAEFDVSLVLDDGPAPVVIDAETITVPELLELAKAAGVKGRHGMSKGQLLDALTAK